VFFFMGNANMFLYKGSMKAADRGDPGGGNPLRVVATKIADPTAFQGASAAAGNYPFRCSMSADGHTFGCLRVAVPAYIHTGWYIFSVTSFSPTPGTEVANTVLIRKFMNGVDSGGAATFQTVLVNGVRTLSVVSSVSGAYKFTLDRTAKTAWFSASSGDGYAQASNTWLVLDLQTGLRDDITTWSYKMANSSGHGDPGDAAMYGVASGTSGAPSYVSACATASCWVRWTHSALTTSDLYTNNMGTQIGLSPGGVYSSARYYLSAFGYTSGYVIGAVTCELGAACPSPPGRYKGEVFKIPVSGSGPIVRLARTYYQLGGEVGDYQWIQHTANAAGSLVAFTSNGGNTTKSYVWVIAE
jgi:hypothetical protein